MTFTYFPLLLILAGIIGTHCQIETVRNVSVALGDSVSVPYSYPPHLQNHVKNVTRGWKFNETETLIITSQPNPQSGRFSISEDTNQHILTLTIKDVIQSDQKRYWCVVETKPNVKQFFQLSVAQSSSLSVNQKEVTAFEGGSMTVECYTTNLQEAGWCKLDSTCVDTINGHIEDTPVEIDKSFSGGFRVTMRELKTNSSGWYWCYNEVNQIPVHLTVSALTSTTTTTTTATPLKPSTTRITTHPQPSSLLTEPHSSPSTIPGSGGGSLQHDHMCPIDVSTIAITAAVTALIFTVIILGLKLIAQRRKKPEVCETSVAPQTPDSDVHYAAIVHKQRVTSQVKIPMEPAVTYSEVVFKNKEEEQTRPADESGMDSAMKDLKAP